MVGVERSGMFDEHRWLARRLASRFSGRGEQIDDLRQVALFALAKAAGRYDESRGTTFRAYATRVVIGELKRHFRDRVWAVKPPRPVHDLYHLVKGANEELTQTTGRAPTVVEVAAHLGIDEDKALEALAADRLYRTVPLDAPRSLGDDHTIDVPVNDDSVDRLDDADQVASLLSRLTADDRGLVELYYFHGMSQSAVAAALGVSQIHVSRRIARIVRHLRAVASIAS
jgi:RNA polymerase sigma-B factor